MNAEKKITIYTKKGDSGETSLIFGSRVSKNNIRVRAYGSIDELNATLGLARSFVKDQKLSKIVQTIQNELFNIGAELASPQKLKKPATKEGTADAYFQLEKAKVEELEAIIDDYDEELPTLKNFILPGGSKEAAFLHFSRTVTRRAERVLSSLSKKEAINPNILAYINRLSDLLFVLARYLNQQSGNKELPWQKT